MRLRNGQTVLVNVTDGTVLRGRATRSWRRRVIRLVEAEALVNSPSGEPVTIPAAGPVLIPHRSVLLVQEVNR